MKIATFNLTNSYLTKKIGFGSAEDNSLDNIYQNKMNLLPTRIQAEVKKTLYKHKKEEIEELPTLRQLHLDIYSNLKECKTLEEAQELYPEFREVLNANDIIKHKSINVKKIEQTIPQKDFSLYMLKQKWGELKTLTEIAEELGLKSRSSLGWFMDKIKFPDLTSNYQTLLKASDPKLNAIITQKTKDYNKKHPEKILEHNRMLAKRQELIQMNRELAEIMWEKMPELKIAMSDFKRLNPDISKKDFAAAFWTAHPEFKEEMSKIRKEIGQKRRLENKKNKQ